MLEYRHFSLFRTFIERREEIKWKWEQRMKDNTKYKMINRKRQKEINFLVPNLKYSILFTVKMDRYLCGFPKCMCVHIVANKFFQDCDFKAVLFCSLSICVGPLD